MAMMGQRLVTSFGSSFMAWHNTQFEHLTSSTISSCAGDASSKNSDGPLRPWSRGLEENLYLVSDLSGIAVSDIVSDEEIALNAYTLALDSLLPSTRPAGTWLLPCLR